jgi:abhydrolase domain-containing protein 17
MEINRILFPAPPCLYNISDIPDLIWVPKANKTSIPCIFLKSLQGSSKILVFFHGNAEDLKSSYNLIDIFRSVLNVNVIAMEYPGYGLYKGKSTEDAILSDSETLYKFVREEFKYNGKDILIFGRSIGTGPATYIARHYEIGALLLMSAYTSIKAVVRHIGGRLAQALVKERFRNIDNMPYIKCPTFLVHGIRDKLIPYAQSQKLHETCAGPCALFLPQYMDHNRFDYCDDLVLPMSTFLVQSQIDVKPRAGDQDVVLNPKYLSPPVAQKIRKDASKVIKFMMNLT